MPLPFLLGGAAVVAGLVGAKKGIDGVSKISDAKKRGEAAEIKFRANKKCYDMENDRTISVLDKFGEIEFSILASFKEFSRIFEKIKNKPEFAESFNDYKFTKKEFEEIKKVSLAADSLMGLTGGIAAGTLGGIAASGATTTAVMALGTASTGTAISALSGAAATNATLAALGGGSLAAGGGGIALGTAVLGGATLGVGLLVGGFIFDASAENALDKVREIERQVSENERLVEEICIYLKELQNIVCQYQSILSSVDSVYRSKLAKLYCLVETIGVTDYNMFSDEDKINLNNVILLVGVLFHMCSVKLLLETEDKNQMKIINKTDINNNEIRGINTLRQLGVY